MANQDVKKDAPVLFRTWPRIKRRLRVLAAANNKDLQEFMEQIAIEKLESMPKDEQEFLDRFEQKYGNTLNEADDAGESDSSEERPSIRKRKG